MKKRDRKPKPAEMGQDQVKNTANLMARKIAEMIENFINKTGQIVAMIEIGTDITQQSDGKLKIMQTVNLKYGVPEQRPPVNALQIERP
jgi:hypothetical protein